MDDRQATQALTTLRGRHSQLLRKRQASRAGVASAFSSDDVSAAIKAFSDWFQGQHKAGHISIPTPGVMRVLPVLSSRFCIGLQDFRYFMGIPVDCFDWFPALPWRYVAVSPGSPTLSLICDEASAGGLKLPAFTLQFEVKAEDYTRFLSNYLFIDIRAVVASDTDPGVFRISREVYAALPVRAEDTEGFLGERLRNDLHSTPPLGSDSVRASASLDAVQTPRSKQ